jgi:hypothetical protein
MYLFQTSRFLVDPYLVYDIRICLSFSFQCLIQLKFWKNFSFLALAYFPNLFFSLTLLTSINAIFAFSQLILHTFKLLIIFTSTRFTVMSTLKISFHFNFL